MKSRWIHLWTGLFVLLVGVFLMWHWPDLHDTAATTFGSVSGFLTFYGVVFACIEVYRSHNASKLAEVAAERVYNKLSGLYLVRDVVSCREAIARVLEVIDKGEPLHSNLVADIINRYCEIFHAAWNDPKSSHRNQVTCLQSLTGSPGKGLGAKKHKEMTDVLYGMVACLSALAGEATTEQGEGAKL